MAKPPARQPRTTPTTSAPSLEPAPDNGVPFAQDSARTSPAAATKKKPTHGRPLGVRIPQEDYAVLEEASRASSIPVRAIILRGIRSELERMKEQGEW